MSIMVLIKNPRKNIAEWVGDYVTVNESGSIDPQASNYINFTCVEVKSSVEKVRQIVKDKVPESRWYKKSNKIEVETSPDIFEFVKEMAKYPANFSNLTEQDKTQLADEKTDASVSDSILTDKGQSATLKQIDSLKVSLVSK